MGIVERLRKQLVVTFGGTDEMGVVTDPICQEAADEIERLREALQEIVKRDACANKHGQKEMSALGWIAYNALREKE